MQRKLLTIAAFAEWLAGLSFLIAPGISVNLLIGTQPDAIGLMVGRVAGAALLSLGIACWGSRADSGGAARSGTLWAITFYNAIVGILLVVFVATGIASGVVVWIAGTLHIVLAVGFVASLRR